MTPLALKKKKSFSNVNRRFSTKMILFILSETWLLISVNRQLNRTPWEQMKE